MGGRKRRVSNSTVASVEDRYVPWTRETSVLKPVSKHVDPDNWPCFVLTDAAIYDTAGRRFANALHVDLEGPFVVRGHLKVEDREQQDYLLRPAVRSAHIEIPKCWSYSIGFGPYPVLWVSGECGWFEINPAPQFQALYEKMCQGITLYYKIMEVYESALALRKPKKAKPPVPPLDHVFLRYAVASGDGVVREEVEQRCHDHSQFLIAHFNKEENFAWKATPFFSWITGLHQDITKQLNDVASGAVPRREVLPGATPPKPEPLDFLASIPARRPPQGKSTSEAKHSKTNSDVDMLDARSVAGMTGDNKPAKQYPQSKVPLPSRPLKSATLPEKKAKAKAESPADSDTAASLGPQSASEPAEGPPVETLKALLIEIASEVDPSRASTSTINSKIHAKCKVKKYGDVLDIISFYAKPLLNDLPAPWKGTAFHGWLKERATTFKPPERLTPEQMRRQLRRRDPKHRAAPVFSAMPGAPRKISVVELRRPDADTGDGAAVLETESDDEGPRRRSGKSGLRVPSSSRKRFTASRDLDDEEGENSQGSRRGRKSARTSHGQWTAAATPAEEEGEEEIDEEDATEDDLAATKGGAALGVPASKGKAEADKETVRIVVHAERMPTMSPSGPNGTWVCSEPDCGYVVRAAEDAEGQQVIQDHFREHEDQARKINLAVAEARRGHMPINHLLEKIQSMGKQSLLSERGPVTNGSPRYPMPINRRVLI